MENNTNTNGNVPVNNNPTPKTKKPIYKKWWFWVIIGVVLIFFIAGASGSNKKKEEKDNNATSAIQKVETKAKEGPKKEKTQFTVGETASNGGVKYKFKKAVVSHGQDFSQPSKGKEFVICVFKVTNKSDDKIDVNAFDFKAYCDDNAVDDSITDGNLYLVEKYGSLSVTDLEPGKKKTGCLTYEVPKGWKKLEINATIDAGVFDSKDVKFVVKNK